MGKPAAHLPLGCGLYPIISIPFTFPLDSMEALVKRMTGSGRGLVISHLARISLTRPLGLVRLLEKMRGMEG